MQALEDAVDELADRTGFSGVVRVDRSGSIELAKAYGPADRGHEISNTIDTQFAIASGTKGLTALAVVSLIEDGSLDLATPARSRLGGDLPLIRDDVTIEHLLSHRSGIGDYLDEEAHHEITDYVMPVPVHELATTEQYLAVLGGHPTAFPPGERFAYCNSGYVVLASIAERASGVEFHELVRRRVCEPACRSEARTSPRRRPPTRCSRTHPTGHGPSRASSTNGRRPKLSSSCGSDGSAPVVDPAVPNGPLLTRNLSLLHSVGLRLVADAVHSPVPSEKEGVMGFRRPLGILVGMLVLGVTMLAAAPAALANGHHEVVTSTMHQHETVSVSGTNPCTGVAITGTRDINAVFHITYFVNEDEVWRSEE